MKYGHLLRMPNGRIFFAGAESSSWVNSMEGAVESGQQVAETKTMQMTKQLESRLKAKQVRPTVMRLLVLEFLREQTSAISLTDIENAFERSDRVTLYRTLKTFQEHGLVHSIDDGTGAPKYALCEEDCQCDIERDLHVHFHCRICHETFCLPNYKIPEIELPETFEPEEATLVVKGVCGKCRTED